MPILLEGLVEIADLPEFFFDAAFARFFAGRRWRVLAEYHRWRTGRIEDGFGGLSAHASLFMAMWMPFRRCESRKLPESPMMSAPST